MLVKEKILCSKDWHIVFLKPAISFTIDGLLFEAVLCLSGMQLVYSTPACMVECVGFVTKAVLISQQCFVYCLERSGFLCFPFLPFLPLEW